MTHRKPVAYRSPVFRIRAPLPLCFPVLTVAPPDLRPATAPTDLQPPPLPRQICDHRETCPPARRPRRELRSARRLEARPGPAGLAPPSSRAATTTRPCHRPPAPQPPSPRRPRATLQSGGQYYLALPPPTGTAATFTCPCRHPPAPQPHQPRRQIPHRIPTTPSGLGNSRANKPSTVAHNPTPPLRTPRQPSTQPVRKIR